MDSPFFRLIGIPTVELEAILYDGYQISPGRRRKTCEVFVEEPKLFREFSR